MKKRRSKNPLKILLCCMCLMAFFGLEVAASEVEDGDGQDARSVISRQSGQKSEDDRQAQQWETAQQHALKQQEKARQIALEQQEKARQIALEQQEKAGEIARKQQEKARQITIEQQEKARQIALEQQERAVQIAQEQQIKAAQITERQQRMAVQLAAAQQIRAVELAVVQSERARKITEEQQARVRKIEAEQQARANGGKYNFDLYDNPHLQQTSSPYVLNKATGKIHHSDCADVRKMKEENAVNFDGTPEEAQMMICDTGKNYSLCGHCFK